MDVVRALVAASAAGFWLPEAERVTMHRDALDVLAEHSHGDPYLLQLVGTQAWEAGDGPVVT